MSFSPLSFPVTQFYPAQTPLEVSQCHELTQLFHHILEQGEVTQLNRLPEATAAAYSSQQLQNWFQMDLYATAQQENAKLPKDLSFLNPLKQPSEIAQATLLFSSFFPNLMNIFLKAFTYITEAKKPIGPFDQGVIIDIYRRFAMIPLTIYYAVDHLLGGKKRKVILTAALVYAVSLAVLYLYLRFRPYPKHLPSDSCDNRTQRIRRGELAPVLSREVDIKHVQALLFPPAGGSIRHVIIVAPMGTGKTTLADGLAWSLREVDVIVVGTPKLDGGFQGRHVAVSDIVNATKGHEEHYVLCFDEFDMAGPELVKAMHPLVERMNQGLRLMLAMTDDAFKSFEKVNPQFLDRLFVLKLRPFEAIEKELILQNHVLTSIKDIPVQPEAITRAAHAESMRKAFNLLDDATAYARLALSHYEDPQVSGWDKQILCLQNKRIIGDGFGSPEPYQTEESSLLAQAQTIQQKREQQEKVRKLLQRIQTLFSLQIRLKLQYAGLTREIATAISPAAVPENRRKAYLVAHHLKQVTAATAVKLEKQLPQGIQVRVNKALVDQVARQKEKVLPDPNDRKDLNDQKDQK